MRKSDSTFSSSYTQFAEAQKKAKVEEQTNRSKSLEEQSSLHLDATRDQSRALLKTLGIDPEEDKFKCLVETTGKCRIRSS